MPQSEKKRSGAGERLLGVAWECTKTETAPMRMIFFLKQKVGCVGILIAHVGTVERPPNSVAALHPTKLKV